MGTVVTLFHKAKIPVTANDNGYNKKHISINIITQGQNFLNNSKRSPIKLPENITYYIDRLNQLLNLRV
jgi:hypothetical protein